MFAITILILFIYGDILGLSQTTISFVLILLLILEALEIMLIAKLFNRFNKFKKQ